MPSYPAAVSTVTVTGTYRWADAQAIAPIGAVSFIPSATLQDAADNVILTPVAVVCPLVDNGNGSSSFTTTLMATDDTDLQPIGWVYQVKESVGGSIRSYDAQFPAAGSPYDLADIAPALPDPLFSYILTSQRGIANGVATLDSGGQVPLAQLGNAPGGSSVTSVNGHVGVVVLAAADVGADASGAATAAQAASQPLDSDLTTIAGLTATTDNVIQSVASAWASRTPAQLKTTLALAKGDVGLGNVDNTSDANKPVSTAQAAADAAVLAASQPVDADLTALAALAATAGMLARTGAGAFAVRTLTGSTETGINNGDGASGNPTLTVTSVAPTASAVGDTVTNGGVATHKHAREAFAAPTGQNQGAGSTGSAATVPHSDHAHPYDLWSHLDHISPGAWTMDPALLAGQTTASPVAGTIYVAKLQVPVALAGVTSIWLHVITAGVGLTANQCLCGLFDTSKNLLATSADQSGSWNSGGTKQITIASSAVPVAAAYVALFQNFATSGARFHAGSNGIAVVNFGLSAANSRFATDSTNTGRTTTMPGTLGTLAASNNALWAAIS